MIGWLFVMTMGRSAGTSLADRSSGRRWTVLHVHCPGQETLSQRSPWNEADSKLLARLKHPVVLHASFDERVFGLDGGNRLNRVRATNGLRARLRKAEVQHLPGLDQILDGAGHVFDWHGEIDAVLIVEIDAIGPEALQRFLDDAPMRSAGCPIRSCHRS